MNGTCKTLYEYTTSSPPEIGTSTEICDLHTGAVIMWGYTLFVIVFFATVAIYFKR